jgi:hypothetical protein
MAIENTDPVVDSGTRAATKTAGDLITADTLRQMLTILDELTDHTHVVYDDYSTACQCNCACGRGIV